MQAPAPAVAPQGPLHQAPASAMVALAVAQQGLALAVPQGWTQQAPAPAVALAAPQGSMQQAPAVALAVAQGSMQQEPAPAVATHCSREEESLSPSQGPLQQPPPEKRESGFGGPRAQTGITVDGANG